MNRVRVAFVGAGNLALSMHYPSLASMPDVDLVAVAELHEERLRTAADRYHIEGRYRDHGRMIEEANPDAVYCIMPPMALWDVVVACLERGRHVFVEKPPGMSAYQAASWARLAEKRGCLTMCGFNRRHIPCLKQAKERVESRGPIRQCMATYMKCYLKDTGYYGGAIDILTVDAVHAVDSLRWLGGEVDRLTSDIGQFSSPFPNAFNALVKFRSGAVGFLVTNWAAGGRVHTWEIHGRGISAYVDPDHEGAILHCDDRLGADRIDPVSSAGCSEKSHTYGFFGEDRHFIDCVKDGRQPSTHFGDAVKTMELIEKIYASKI
ncbi:MAG: Gfo/Idh/MocA family oxidoreductase [Planctomycetes bacterium]|nr:Gfo/Idh/MocA family oxidoreductase [Planctomycetota bacterium]